MCNHICQNDKKTTTIDGVKTNYSIVIHVDGVTKLGLEEDICEDCKRESG